MSRAFVPEGPEQVEDQEAPEAKGLAHAASRHSLGPYVLCGPALSYFTRKLHAALHWSHLPYRWLPKHAGNLAAVEARAATHQVPVLLTPENWVVGDTTPQLHLLDGRLPHALFFPTYNRALGVSTAVTGALVQVAEEYLDEWLPRAAILYRWAYADSAAHASAMLGRDAASGMGAQAQAAAGTMIQAWGSKAMRALGLAEEEERRLMEEEFLRVFSALDAHIGRQWAARGGRSPVFVLGGTPCAIDAVLAGSLWAHFASDPAAAKVLRQHCPRVIQWADDLHRMQSGTWAWEEHAPVDTARLDEGFLGALLGLMGPFLVFLRENARALVAGQKAFTADVYGCGRAVSYLTRPYPELSRRQASRWIRLHLSAEERRQLEAILARYGIADFLADDGLSPFSRL